MENDISLDLLLSGNTLGMLNSYDMPLLRLKLNSGDPIDADRAIFTLLRHIDRLDERVGAIEKELRQLKGEPEKTS
ncbi:MAG TPA: hypothetical protein VGL56_01425 [Fimbriimonadaceae bacterium]|jgi:hypothetical protein